MFNLFNVNTLTSASNTYSSASWLAVQNVVAPQIDEGLGDVRFLEHRALRT